MPETLPTISISDVARHAGVSLGTVSRVINHHPSVGSEMRRKVVRSSRELGFRPKVARRSVAIVSGRHSPGLPVGFVSIVSSLIAQHLARRGVVVELVDADALDLVYESHVDGVIGVVFDDRLCELTESLDLPVFTINKPLADRGVHSVYADHYKQGLDATRLLLDHGHERIAFLAIEPDEWGSAQRRAGYRDAFTLRGLAPDPSYVGYSQDSPLQDTLTAWVRDGVTALLNFSEDAGMQAFHVLANQLGLRIGRDISTVTLEDLPIYQYLAPPQTVVRQPLEAMVEIAVEQLIRRIEKPDIQEVVDRLLPTELVVRESVGPPPDQTRSR